MRSLPLLLLVILFLFPSTSGAEEEWEPAAFKGWTVRSVVIEGLDKELARELRRGLALAISTGFLRKQSAIFYPQVLDDDMERSLLFLARRGHPYALITNRFEPAERTEEVTVIFEVTPGPAVLITSVSVVGLPPSTENDADEKLGVREGSVFEDDDLKDTVAALDAMLKNKGYARAVIKSDVQWRDSTRVSVHLDVQPGTLFYFGDVVITGADADMIALVRKNVSARRGKIYSPDAIRDSERNLRVLGLFRKVHLELEESAADTVDVAVDIIMREPRTLSAGVRYWTDERLDVGARWEHRNLFKAGRGGAVLVSASAILQRLEFSSWWPAILWARSRGSGTIGVRRENEESYEEEAIGLELALRHHHSLQTVTRFGIGVSNVNVTKKTAVAVVPTEEGLLTSLNLSWEQRRTDDFITPSQGTYARIFTEWAPAGRVSDNSFVKLETTGSTYLPLRATVLALRLTLGVAEPIGESNSILFSKRFYSGGSNSMRGFHRRRLGPKDLANAPVGGNAKAEGSVELRFPIFWRFRGSLFVDTGQVWSEVGDAGFNEIEVAVGPGLWLQTIIGPLRTDLGYRITDFDPTEPRWVFHFSVGPAF
jgi:outer membrane protein assembly complex protein YaeT